MDQQQCPFCEKHISSVSQRNRHIRAHDLDTWERCPDPDCNVRMSQKTNIKRHYASKHMHDWWQCSMCPFTNKDVYKMRNHNRTKHGGAAEITKIGSPATISMAAPARTLAQDTSPSEYGRPHAAFPSNDWLNTELAPNYPPWSSPIAAIPSGQILDPHHLNHIPLVAGAASGWPNIYADRTLTTAEQIPSPRPSASFAVEGMTSNQYADDVQHRELGAIDQSICAYPDGGRADSRLRSSPLDRAQSFDLAPFTLQAVPGALAFQFLQVHASYPPGNWMEMPGDGISPVRQTGASGAAVCYPQLSGSNGSRNEMHRSGIRQTTRLASQEQLPVSDELPSTLQGAHHFVLFPPNSRIFNSPSYYHTTNPPTSHSARSWGTYAHPQFGS